MHAAPESPSAVLRLAIPIILANLSVPLVGLTDVAVLGRGSSAASLAAIALGAAAFSAVFWAFGFLRMGTTGVAAQAVGAADGAALRRVVVQSFAMAALIGFALVLLRGPLLWLVQRAMPASADAHAGLRTYFGIRIFSGPAVLANYVFVGLFIALRRSVDALVSQLVLNVGNVVLAVVFVVGLRQGIAGAAWASVLAEWASIGVCAWLLARALRRVPGAWPHGPDRRGLRALLGVNANLFVRTLCLLGATVWFSRQGGALGDVVLAANAVLMQLVQLLSNGLDGFAHAAETLVGAAVGARDLQRLRRAIRTTTLLAAGTAGVYALVYAAAGASFIDAMTTIDDVRAEARAMLPLLVAACLTAVWSFQLDGIFIGALRIRDMRDTMIVALAVFIGASTALIPHFGNGGLWFSYLLMFAVRTVGLGARLGRVSSVIGQAAGSANAAAR